MIGSGNFLADVRKVYYTPPDVLDYINSHKGTQMTRKLLVVLSIVVLGAGIAAYFHLKRKIGKDIFDAFDAWGM